MKKVEFDYAMRALGMNESRLNVGSFAAGSYIDKYKLGDITIFFEDGVVVEGDIPIEVVMDLYSEYPDNRYQIYLERRCAVFNPNDYKEKDSCSKLVICTTPGLILFVTTMKDCLAAKKGLEKTEKNRFYDIWGEVTTNVIAIHNLKVTTKEWMMHNYYSNVYFEGLRKSEHLPLIKTKKKLADVEVNKTLRSNIVEFDHMINPFMNRNNQFLDMSTILQNVDIRVDDASIISDQYTNNSVLLDIRDKNNNSTFYLRGKKGFSYTVNYMLDDCTNFMLTHSFGNNKSGLLGEYIWIEKKNLSDNTVQFDLLYNITSNAIKRDNGGTVLATISDKEEVYRNLLMATAFAKNITLDNMVKSNGYIKKGTGV